MGYLQDHFPRIVQDEEGYIERMGADVRWPEIADLIKQAEAGGEVLSNSDKISIISNYLRGYDHGQINIHTPGNTKTRTIAVLSPELNNFYMEWREAVVNYIAGMNKMIAGREFFGKSLKQKEAGFDLFGVKVGEVDLEKSIGAYVLNAVQGGHVKKLDEHLLKHALSSYFNPKQMGLAMRIYRDITVMQTLGNIVPALTQIQDLDKAMTRAPLNAIPALFKAVLNKSNIKLSDVGLDAIAEEFTSKTRLSKAVAKTLKWAGLEFLDRVTAETPMNAIIEKYRSQARRGMVGGLEERLRDAVGDRWESTAKDLAEGRKTWDVLAVAINTILDMQAKAPTEVPVGYHEAGDGRIFYFLKTFALRHWDYLRSETFDKMKQPGMKNKAIGIGRLLSLIATAAALRIGVDSIKDWLLGRKTDFNTRMTDALLTSIGISKWGIYKAREEGIGTALMKGILPPAPMFDLISKDIRNAGDGKGLESAKLIPLVGNPYYWRFGRGREKTLAKHPELRTPSIDSRGRTIRPRPAPTQRSQLRQRVMVKR